MARINVNPTRMELTRLKKRLAMAVRGHKLLKDKRDEMMRQFVGLVRENAALREQVERDKPTVQECIETIKASGGKTVLAHPYQIGLENEALDRLVGKLVSAYGLDGMECFYPKHTPAQTAFYLSLAQKHRIHVTGGSDFHGKLVKPDVNLMPWRLDIRWLLE